MHWRQLVAFLFARPCSAVILWSDREQRLITPESRRHTYILDLPSLNHSVEDMVERVS